MKIDLAGERVLLLPERALFWIRESTLVIADVHLGKTITFRKNAIPIPRGTTEDDLHRLSTLLSTHQAKRLIVLGDLIHARSSQGPELSPRLFRWCQDHFQVELVMVRGNHDLKAGDPPSNWRFKCVDEPFIKFPFEFRHHPVGQREKPKDRFVLAGHLHPSVQLRGKAKQRMRLPAFIFGSNSGLLPAFGGFTGNSLVRPGPDDRVFVIAENLVLMV